MCHCDNVKRRKREQLFDFKLRERNRSADVVYEFVLSFHAPIISATIVIMKADVSSSSSPSQRQDGASHLFPFENKFIIETIGRSHCIGENDNREKLKWWIFRVCQEKPQQKFSPNTVPRKLFPRSNIPPLVAKKKMKFKRSKGWPRTTSKQSA